MRIFVERLGCLALLALVGGCSAWLGDGVGPSPESRVVGTWKGQDQLGQEMQLTLEDDGTMTLRVGNARGSFIKQGTYSVDMSQSPAHFNIKLTDRDEIRTICALIDNDRLAFESINSSDPRPTKLGPNQMVLERQ